MPISDELLDHLGDVYLKYPFKMTFIDFVEKVITRKEKRNRAVASYASRPIHLVSITPTDSVAVWVMENYHHSHKQPQANLLAQS